MTYELHEMDCRLAMSMLLDADSVDAIVTDPPYGLSKEPDVEEVLRHWLEGDDYVHDGSGFMGKTWDSFVPGPAVWREAYRVLKPGGHLVAFFGTRTYDLGVMALRMAGFEIRDQLAWVFGSGFPKSHDVSKGIDKNLASIDRFEEIRSHIRLWKTDRGFNNRQLNEALGLETAGCGMARHWTSEKGGQHAIPSKDQWLNLKRVLGWPDCELDSEYAALRDGADRPIFGTKNGSKLAVAPGQENDRSAKSLDLTAPATPEAAQWQGWGTALKPAYEPIVLARKPITSTVAANVLQYGTGAINIDGCRVTGGYVKYNNAFARDAGTRDREQYRTGTTVGSAIPSDQGRWPANLCHDGSPEVLAEFPDSKGQLASVGPANGDRSSVNTYGDYGPRPETPPRGDSGSAARFFYCAKASKSDRNEGLDDLPPGPSAASQFRPNHAEGAANGEDGNPYGRWSPVRNIHPTVKPTDLMRWLVRLITPPGGTVLDPFAGSGSTGKAAILEGFSFVGCEMTPEYADIARRRIDHAVNSR